MPLTIGHIDIMHLIAHAFQHMNSIKMRFLAQFSDAVKIACITSLTFNLALTQLPLQVEPAWTKQSPTLFDYSKEYTLSSLCPSLDTPRRMLLPVFVWSGSPEISRK